MNFNSHSNLEGQHAFMSASNWYWTNDNDEEFVKRYLRAKAAQRGTELHAHAANCIKYGTKLTRSKQTLNMHVNDAIGYHMTPELVLRYSDNCFGTADAISFRDNLLRIHDLKTGVTPAHMRQLEIYAALFCLEYGKKPGTIDMDLRIYQNNEIEVYNPEADDILPIMDMIVRRNKIIEELKEEG